MHWLFRTLSGLIPGRKIENDTEIELKTGVVVLAPFQLNLLDLFNSYRVEHGLAILVINQCLNNAAQGHATWMAKANKLTHFGAHNEIFIARQKAAGYEIWSGGENLAYGYVTEKEVFDALAASKSHRDNILSSIFVDVGIGRAASKSGNYYWAVNFGTRIKASIPLFNSSGTLTKLPQSSD